MQRLMQISDQMDNENEGNGWGYPSAIVDASAKLILRSARAFFKAVDARAASTESEDFDFSTRMFSATAPTNSWPGPLKANAVEQTTRAASTVQETRVGYIKTGGQ